MKVINNPAGPHVLAREWIGFRLCTWFGLPTPEYAIMEIRPGDEIPLANGDRAVPGPTFVTRALQGHPWGGDAIELKLLDNPECLSRLVVFDTWTRNPDRCPPPSASHQRHYDNVFFAETGAMPKKFRLVVIDHSESLVPSCRSLGTDVAKIDNIRDEGLFGMFPEFREVICFDEVASACNHLRSVTGGLLREVVDGIPTSWDVGPAVRAAIVELLLQRAGFVAEHIGKLVREACGILPF